MIEKQTFLGADALYGFEVERYLALFHSYSCLAAVKTLFKIKTKHNEKFNIYISNNQKKVQK